MSVKSNLFFHWPLWIKKFSCWVTLDIAEAPGRSCCSLQKEEKLYLFHKEPQQYDPLSCLPLSAFWLQRSSKISRSFLCRKVCSLLSEELLGSSLAGLSGHPKNDQTKTISNSSCPLTVSRSLTGLTPGCPLEIKSSNFSGCHKLRKNLKITEVKNTWRNGLGWGFWNKTLTYFIQTCKLRLRPAPQDKQFFHPTGRSLCMCLPHCKEISTSPLSLFKARTNLPCCS